MPIIEGIGTVGGGLSAGRRRVVARRYDFAVSGGAVGDIALAGDVIPSGAIIVDAYLRVLTVPTSAGAATIAIKVEGSADIQAAAAISGAPWSTAGAKRLTFLSTTAPVLTTAARSVTATVAVAALTAGVFTVVVEYIELG